MFLNTFHSRSPHNINYKTCPGKLWISLADYYIRKHQFDKARDIYEEAVKTVMTVRDFGQVCFYWASIIKRDYKLSC